jgi:hypothetical protein
MLPYYPTRDGHPSMREADDDAGSPIATQLHQSFVHRPATRLPARPFASVLVGCSQRDLRQGYPRWSSVRGQEARFSGALAGVSI